MAAFNHHKVLEKKLRSQCCKLREFLFSRRETCQSAGVELANKASTRHDDVTKLQNDLKDALEKNEKWLKYDREREAYVKAMLDRVSSLETILEEHQQHNEEHSDENMSPMQEHYESLLDQGNDELNIPREQFALVQQNLTVTQSRCEEKVRETEGRKEQLQTQKMGLVEDEEKHLNTKMNNFKKQQEKVKRTSDSEWQEDGQWESPQVLRTWKTSTITRLEFMISGLLLIGSGILLIYRKIGLRWQNYWKPQSSTKGAKLSEVSQMGL